MLSTEFLLTSLIVVLIPGTGVIYTISMGLLKGRRASFYASIGCTMGIVPHLVASVLGIAALLHTSALAFQLVKYAGVCYLLYLAWGMWKDTGAMSFNDDTSTSGDWNIAIRAFLINILNPKLSLFFLAFLPQFVPANSASPMSQMLLLSGVFMLMTFVVFVAYGVSAHAVRAYVAHSPALMKKIQKTFAGMFVLLGARLATAER